MTDHRHRDETIDPDRPRSPIDDLGEIGFGDVKPNLFLARATTSSFVLRST